MQSRRTFLAGISAAAFGSLALSALGQATRNGRRMNVLFIGVDDLRCSLGCYGDPIAITPNIDRLAKRGMLFERAYVQQAVCAASRASMLTGCRPDTTGVDYPYTDEFINNFVKSHPTIPTWFDDHDYFARIGGKIHHQAVNKIEQLDGEEFGRKPGPWIDYQLPHNVERTERKERGDPYEMADVEDNAYRDGFIAEKAVEAMRDYAGGDRTEPLFLGVGFIKPHLPFNAPRKYWDLYDRDSMPLAGSPEAPAGTPGFAQATYELPSYHGGYGTEENPITDDLARTLRHAYYACVSFIDAQVGKLLAALEETGLADNTLICFWSDHGFHLGDNGMWGKHVNYEVATRAPLIFAGPGVPAGQRTDALVEYVDMYPTLCDLTGVKTPQFVEGKSLRPLMDDPEAPWDDAAFSQYPRGTMEGYSIRTDRWRYVEWRQKNEQPHPIVGRELYDEQNDPLESTNLASERREVVAELSDRLAEHFGWSDA